MKEAIGTSMVFNLAIIFIGVMIALLVGVSAYSKGFKIRNRILNRIEEYSGYTQTSGDRSAKEVIEEDLKDLGYRITKINNCKPIVKQRKNGEQYVVKLLTDSSSNAYNYCVYEYTTSKGVYYGVTVFIAIDIPIIGDTIHIPLYGETDIIYDKRMVEG